MVVIYNLNKKETSPEFSVQVVKKSSSSMLNTHISAVLWCATLLSRRRQTALALQQSQRMHPHGAPQYARPRMCKVLDGG